MLGDTTGSSRDGDFVQFVQAGTEVAGAYRCSACGYGVTVRAALPTCPMCAGSTWEQAAWGNVASVRPAATLQ